MKHRHTDILVEKTANNTANSPANSLTVFLFLAALSISFGTTATADDSTHSEASKTSIDLSHQTNTDVIVVTGVRQLATLMWGFIPAPPSVAVAVDRNHFRFRTDMSYHFAGAFHATAGAGYVFYPVGQNSRQTGGFQMKIPFMFEAGYARGTLEAGDGYNDDISWILLGPSAGIDLTWYKAQKLGFTIAIKSAWQFRIDAGSDYIDDGVYSYAHDTPGIWDNSVLFGVVF